MNLLQPQDRKSKEPGDTKQAIAGRRSLHDRGFTQPLLRAIQEFTGITQSDVVLDAGCGEGFYLASLQRETHCDAHGVDISIPAIDAAARRYPDCEWVVANADRFVPYADRSFSLVLSITARMNSVEFRRVLREDGRLLVAVPAPDDLVEVRGTGRDRVQRTVDAFSPVFSLERQTRVSTTTDVDAAAVLDVLHSIYRPLQSKPIETGRLTFALDLLLFRCSGM